MIAVRLHVADLEEEVQLSRRPYVDAIGDDGDGHRWADSAQRSTSMPSDSASIRSSSSAVNAGPSRAARFSSSCSGRDAPMSADATTGSRSTHWIASCASDCPRSLAMTSSPRTVARPLALSVDCGSDERCWARSAVPSPRYLSVRRPCASGVKAIAPMTLLLQDARQPVLDPAVQDRVRRLVDDERRAEAPRDRGGDSRALGAVRRDADVERLALPHERVERPDGLLDRRHRVDAVRVEDVDVVDAHARQRLLGAREDVLARPEVAVGARPHVVAGLGRDDQLVAIAARSPRASSRPKFVSAEPYGGP